METITIPRQEFEDMKQELEELRKSKNSNTDELALLSEESFAETWSNEKEDEAWKDL
jgi:hypothetical protein|tara:strand:+ start:200 stop:370 length:171 start_codon:yes stop_codon:yes gene_type:complete